MTIEQILTDITAVLGSIGVISSVLAHLPLPAKYAEFFARLATYAANTKFSVNVREQPPKKPSVPPLGVLMLVVCFAAGVAGGCSLFGSKGSVWPALGACAPTGETLFSEVESVLTSSGGSYEDDLLALGKTEGLAFVECAVKAVVDQLSARIAARRPGERITPDEGIGVARGKAFLAKIAEAHK